MSQSMNKSEVRIDRRGFLKGIAATGAMSTIAAGCAATPIQRVSESLPAAKSWRDKPDPINERLISDGGTYDVVVVGGGNSGLVCARAASNKGASVAVIETQAAQSYELGFGKEVGTVNSQFALDRGAPRIDEDDFLREWARRNVIRHNPKRASYFVKNSGRIFDWLIRFAPDGWMEENCHVMSCPPRPEVLMEVSGWKFYYGSAIFLNPKSKTYGYETWPELLKIHHEKAMADGAKWFNGHHAEQCDVDGTGAVTGVVARRSDGKYVRFRARKGIALCAGGFVGDREMVLDILDTVRHEAEARGDLSLVRGRGGGGGYERAGMGHLRDGFGIKMGVWAGGHVEIGPRSTMGSGDPGTGVWYLQLDHNGERFYDEAAGTTLNQPSDSFTVTFNDANWQKVYRMMPPRHMGPDSGDTISWAGSLNQLKDVEPGPEKYSWGNEIYIRGPMRGGSLYCANTIEELLDTMDCYKGETRKKALASIERYNRMCERGVDEDFGKDRRIMQVTALKDPPFFGTLNKNAALGMMGATSAGMVSTTGLDTDAEGRVLDSDFKPIKGLYAAGNNAGGRFIVVYQTPISGISIGMAVTEGFMLGEMLADM